MAFGRFGKILYVDMRTTSNSAVIEFFELREASLAMSAHSRDPLRLGGRPLRLSYAPSRPSSCLWLADLPTRLSSLPETELLALFSRIVPVEQMSRINRSTGNQHQPTLTSLHTAAFVRLSTPEAAARLLSYLRSPGSPLFAPSASPAAVSQPLRPPPMCPSDFASPHLIERFSALLNGKSRTGSPCVYATNRVGNNSETGPRHQRHHRRHHRHHHGDNQAHRKHSGGEEFSVSASSLDSISSSSTSASTASSSFLPLKRCAVETDECSIGVPSSRRLHPCTSSWQPVVSCRSNSGSGGNHVTSGTSASTATFPSQRRIHETLSYAHQKKMSDSSSSRVVSESQNDSFLSRQKIGHNDTLVFSHGPTASMDSTSESMYDKIKRRTVLTEKRKRPSVDMSVGEEEEDGSLDVDGRSILKQKKRRKRPYFEDEDNMVDEVDARQHRPSYKSTRKYKRKHSVSPEPAPKASSHHNSKKASKDVHRRGKRDLVAANSAYPSSGSSQQHSANTITRLSLGMSVPVAASYHPISKTKTSVSNSVQRPSSNFLDSSSSSSGSDIENVLNQRQAPNLSTASPTPSAALKWYSNATENTHTAPQVSRSFSLNDAESDTKSSSSFSTTFSPAMASQKKERKHHQLGEKTSMTTSARIAPSLSAKRRPQLSVPSPCSSFRTGRGWSSSSLSSHEDLESEKKYHLATKPTGLLANGGVAKTYAKSAKYPRHLKLAVGQTKSSKTNTKVRSLSESSSDERVHRSGSLISSHSGSMLSVVHRQLKSSPWRESSQTKPPPRESGYSNCLNGDDHYCGGGRDDGDDDDSLDDLDRYSGDSRSTPSTEAMESYAGGLDDEVDRLVTDWPSCISSGNSLLSDPDDSMQPSSTFLGRNEDDGDKKMGEEEEEEAKPTAGHLSRKFEEVTLLNCSKDESLNSSGLDAIGEIRMDNETSSKLNESMDKSSTPKSTVILVEEEVLTHKPEPPHTPEDVKPGSETILLVTLPSPPPLGVESFSQPTPSLVAPPNPQLIISPYSSCSPTPSLCSACSQSSPSFVLTTARTCTTSMTQPESTPGVNTVATSEPARPVLAPEEENDGAPSESLDLKRYVRSVIERVKAEKVDHVQQMTPQQPQYSASQSRSGNTSSTTPLMSPQRLLNSSSPIGLILRKKSISPSVSVTSGPSSATPTVKQQRGSISPRTSTPTMPSPVTRSVVSRTAQRSTQLEAPVSLLSIPGVNACAPVSDVATSASVVSPKEPIAQAAALKPTATVEELHGETKQLRSTPRRRAKATPVALPTNTVGEQEEAAAVLTEKPPPRPADPYEPNFDDDDDSPPMAIIKPGTSPLVVNTNLIENASASSATGCGPASSISSVTTEEALPSQTSTTPADDHSPFIATSKSVNRKRALDTVDEVMDEVCAGEFNIQSYMDNFRNPSGTQTTSPTSNTTSASTKPLSTTTPASTMPTSDSCSSPIAATTVTPPSTGPLKPEIMSATQNNNLISVIWNALSSIPGSQVVIGSAPGTNGAVTATSNTPSVCAASGSTPPVASITKQKQSPGVVVGSARTITVPLNAAFLKNVISAASGTASAVVNNVASSPPTSVKPSSENCPPVSMANASATPPHLHVNHQPTAYGLATIRPQSTTTTSNEGAMPDPVARSSRVRHGSDSAAPCQQGVAQARAQAAAAAASVSAVYFTDHGRSRSNVGPSEEPPQTQPPNFYLRGFTSPLRPPVLSPPSTLRQAQPQPAVPWHTTPNYAPYPTSPQRVPQFASFLEKLSRVVDPETLVSLIQRIQMQENQSSGVDFISTIRKLAQQMTGNGGSGGGAAAAAAVETGPASSTSSTPSPSQCSVSAAFGGAAAQQPPVSAVSLPSRERGSPAGSFALPPGASGSCRADAFTHPSSLTPPYAASAVQPQQQQQQQQYPLVWQGRLSLKNAEASVKLHFVQGNGDLLRSCMALLSLGGGGTPQQALVTSGGPLRIVQRMRLESAQLDGVQRKMTQERAYCACIAFAAGTNREELAAQNAALSEGFIRYMLDKRAAGIINVGHPDMLQGLYVVHIFPPCEFSYTQLLLAAPDLQQSLLHTQLPHLLIVITTV